MPHYGCWALPLLPYFKNSKKFKLPDLDESQILKYMFKYLNLNGNILQKHSDGHNYNTRNNNNFISPNYNMKKTENRTSF